MVIVTRLVWDSWNVDHISRRSVLPSEVEAACHGDHIILQGYQQRLLLIAPAGTRMLAVVLKPQAEDRVYYAITARDAGRKERAYYRQRKEDGIE